MSVSSAMIDDNPKPLQKKRFFKNLKLQQFYIKLQFPETYQDKPKAHLVGFKRQFILETEGK